MIDLLEPEPSSQGHQPTSRKRRWSPGGSSLIAALLAMVVIVSVVAASVASFGDESPSRSATVPPTTTAAAPATPSPSIFSSSTPLRPQANPLARLVGVLPDGYAMRDVQELDPTYQVPVTSGLWANAPSASPATTWLLATSEPFEFGLARSGTMRIATPSGSAVIGADQHGFTIRAPVGGGVLAIRSHGVTPDALIAIIEVAAIVDDKIVIPATTLPEGVESIAQTARVPEPVWSPLTETTADPITPTDATARVALVVDVGAPLTDFQHALDSFFVVDTSAVDINGQQARLGTDVLSERRTVSFDRAGLHVNVNAAPIIGDDALVSYARSLQHPTADTWARLINKLPPPQPHLSQPRRIAGGTLSGGTWEIYTRVDTNAPNHVSFEFRQTTNGVGNGINDAVDASAPSITANATGELTFIAAAAPSEDHPVSLRIIIGSTTTNTPFTPIDASTTVGAATALTEPGAYIVEVVAANGAVLARYNPLAPPPSS